MLTFSTAFNTPFPLNLDPPSLSSMASLVPVEAPDGTAALPNIPFSNITSTSTVGLPLVSCFYVFYFHNYPPKYIVSHLLIIS